MKKHRMWIVFSLILVLIFAGIPLLIKVLKEAENQGDISRNVHSPDAPNWTHLANKDEPEPPVEVVTKAPFKGKLGYGRVDPDDLLVKKSTPADAAPTPAQILASARKAYFDSQKQDREISPVLRTVESATANGENVFIETETKGRWVTEDTLPVDVASTFPVDHSRTLTADMTIGALLISSIRSDLGGQVTALIERHVFATHGEKILIPAGSKAIGTYAAISEAGTERLAVTWNRIITPRGVDIVIPNSQGTDAMGRNGLTGEVDDRGGDRYNRALITSLIPIPAAEQIVGAQIADGKDIKPRLTIAHGTRITINPTQDIFFKKPVWVAGKRTITIRGAK